MQHRITTPCRASAWCLVCCCSPAPLPWREAPRPNIVFILMDDLLGRARLHGPSVRQDAEHRPHRPRRARSSATPSRRRRSARRAGPASSPASIRTPTASPTTSTAARSATRSSRSRGCCTTPATRRASSASGTWASTTRRRPGFDYWVSVKGQGTYIDPELNDGRPERESRIRDRHLQRRAVAFIAEAHDRPFLLYCRTRRSIPRRNSERTARLVDPNASQFLPAPRHRDLDAGAERLFGGDSSESDGRTDTGPAIQSTSTRTSVPGILSWRAGSRTGWTNCVNVSSATRTTRGNRRDRAASAWLTTATRAPIEADAPRAFASVAVASSRSAVLISAIVGAPIARSRDVRRPKRRSRSAIRDPFGLRDPSETIVQCSQGGLSSGTVSGRAPDPRHIETGIGPGLRRLVGVVTADWSRS